MSDSNAITVPTSMVVVGGDTHKHTHVAVALNALGARLASCEASANRAGYAELVSWTRALGTVEAFGIEGTGSYGVGLASFVRRAIRVVCGVNVSDVPYISVADTADFPTFKEEVRSCFTISTDS
jgi:transposase